MSEVIRQPVAEGSTAVYTISFFDEDDNAVVPNSAKWSLYDKSGAIVNLREDVVIAIPATTNTIVLSGDDLKVNDRYKLVFLLVEAIYDSSVGNDLPLTQEFQISISDFVGIS